MKHSHPISYCGWFSKLHTLKNVRVLSAHRLRPFAVSFLLPRLVPRRVLNEHMWILACSWCWGGHCSRWVHGLSMCLTPCCRNSAVTAFDRRDFWMVLSLVRTSSSCYQEWPVRLSRHGSFSSYSGPCVSYFRSLPISTSFNSDLKKTNLVVFLVAG